MAIHERHDCWARCDVCGRESPLYNGPKAMADALALEGWEVAPGLVRCPLCNETGELPEEFRIEVVEVARGPGC